MNSNEVVMPEVATETQNPKMTLRIPWRDAAQQIQAHLKIGRAIKNQRIRDQWELDHARAEKAEWIRRSTDLLTRVFHEETLAEQNANYAPAVLPEYAEFDLFVDQFEDEMRRRLEMLQQVLQQLDTLPEALPSASGANRAEPVGQVESADSDEINQAEIEIDGPATVMEDSMSAVLNEALGMTEDPRPVAASPRPATPQRQAHGLLILATTNESARSTVGDFLRELDFEIELIDQAAAPGKSVAEMLANDQHDAFAVIVADVSEIQHDASTWEFELGFCAGRLGAGRVFVATPTAPGAQALSDRHGIHHLAIDPTGGWQLQLARHLKRAGVQIDLNRLC